MNIRLEDLEAWKTGQKMAELNLPNISRFQWLPVDERQLLNIIETTSA
jgi:hypothetical protein